MKDADRNHIETIGHSRHVESDPDSRSPIIRLIVVLVIAEVALGLAHLINFLIGDPFRGSLFLGSEQSVGTWFSSGQLLVVALVAGAAVYPRVSRADPTSWLLLILPLAFLFLSLDEIAMFHETIAAGSGRFLPGGSVSGTPFSRTGIWMFLLGVPFLILATLWLYWFTGRFHPPTRIVRKMTAGTLVFLTGAVVVEGFSNAIPDDYSLEYALQVLVEESLEMIGITIVLWAVYDLLHHSGFVFPPNRDGTRHQ